MWFFVVLTLLSNGDIAKERFKFATWEACVVVRAVQWHQLKDLGNFVVTECEEVQ